MPIPFTVLDPNLGSVDDRFTAYVRDQEMHLQQVQGRELDILAEQVFHISRERELPIYDFGVDGTRITHYPYESDEMLRRRILRVIQNPGSYPPGSVARTLASGHELPWLVAKIKPEEPKRMTRWERLLSPIL